MNKETHGYLTALEDVRTMIGLADRGMGIFNLTTLESILRRLKSDKEYQAKL